MSISGDDAYILSMDYTDERIEQVGGVTIDDKNIKPNSTWSSEKIANELGQVFDNLTPEQIKTLREVTDSTYLATGSIDMENETVTFDQTFEEIKTAYLEGKAILVEMLVDGEAKYIFNPLYVLVDAISFEWINSAAKLGVQINLMEDNSAALSVTSLEGSEGSEALDTLVVTGNYSTDDADNWTVSNIDKTFVEINEAITNNQDVVLKIYPENDTTNPYILYPAMHYANMGTAFSLMVSDTGQISGLSVMITKDNQVMATRNEYDFEALKKSVSDGKTLVAGAITGKGIETAADAEFATMAENIGKIEAPVIDFKFAEGTEGVHSTAIAIGSNTIIAWMNKSIYYSEDGGKTWNLSDLQTEYGNTPTVIYAKEYDVFVVLVPYTNHGIYVSTDGGKTWALKMGYSNVNTLRYSGGIFVGCSSTTTSGGITYSMDGVHWSLNSSFLSKAITNLSCVNGRWFFVANGTTYTSVDGYNWTGLTGTAAGYSLSNIKCYQGLWVANGSNSTIFYSTDGVTWNVCTFNWSNTQYGTSIQSINRVGNNYVASTYNGMYYSTDRGKTWNPSNITSGNHSFKLFKGIILAIGVGGPSAGKGVYTSSDGKTWTQSTLPNTGAPSSDVFFKGGKALITANDGALYSSTDGSTWEYVSGSRKIIAEFNGILLTNDFNYSVDGVTWKRASIDATIATTYWLGGNFILTHSNETAFRGLYYSKAYFS